MMTHSIPHLLLATLLVVQPGDEKRDALESIESTRGGRHWIDDKPEPPKSAEESLAAFRVEPGLKVELVAAEPLVVDPVAVAFDERGRLFAVEYRDYPNGPEAEDAPPMSRVVLLEDTDGDGRMDRRHVFADELTYAHSLMPFRGGLLVGAQTEVLFLKDTTGDNRADIREVVFGGFTPAHPQMQIGNPRWGKDNWIYLNYGPGKVHLGPGAKRLNPECDPSASESRTMPRGEFRFHPRTLEFGPAAGLGQYGNTIDNFGRRFFGSNRNPIMTAPLSLEQIARNPYLVVPKAHHDVGPAGGATRVFPLVEMKSNYLSHAGTHTAACGTTAYRGDLLGSEYAESVFVCEPIGHLVTRSIIQQDGASVTAVRARPKADFLASTDTWCRPSSLATGPDGALYVADMYRLWVEHPKFLPPDIAKRIDWRAGDDRGRIWRIVPDTEVKPRPFVPPKTTADRVALLSDPNGWRRWLGQRLLVQKQEQNAATALRKLLSEGVFHARLHALWTLDGLGALTSGDLLKTSRDAEPVVRAEVARLAAPFVQTDSRLLDQLLTLADDTDIRVRFQVALALGESDDARVTATLTKLAAQDGADSWFAIAILSSARERSGAILASLIKEFKETDPRLLGLVRDLATVVGHRGDVAEIGVVLGTLGDTTHDGSWWQTATLMGLATGLPRHQGELGRINLTKLLAEPPMSLAQAVRPVQALLDRTESVTIDAKRSVADRVAAIRLLGYRPFDQSSDVFGELLAFGQPLEVQQACIEAMRQVGDAKAAALVLDRWPSLGPRVRGPALGLLLSRPASTEQMLLAMAKGTISPAILDVDGRVRLLRHSNPTIRGLAEELLGGAVSADRRAVAREYQAALKLKGAIPSGAKVFEQNCAKCHRIDGMGHEVGPDLSDVRNRSTEALLYDILDPNQKLEPQYTDYIVTTLDGRVFNGLMLSESAEAIVLGQPEGKRQTIARNEIDEIQGSGKSLMPEGVEKEINVQQMADLLAFLKGRELTGEP